MLVKRDLGFSSLVFLVLVAILTVIVLILRRKWRHSVARSEEVKRLLVSVSEESARVEFEAREEYYYAATVTGVGIPSARVSVSTRVDGSPLKPQYQCAVCFCHTTTRCANCKVVRYCSGKCQIVHWRQGHKDECCPYVAASPINNVVGGSNRQRNRKDDNDSFDNESKQIATPTKFSEGVTSETVKSAHQTSVNPSRMSNVIRDSNQKTSSLTVGDTQSGTSSSSFWSDDSSNESSLFGPSTNSFGFLAGPNINKKPTVTAHEDFPPVSVGEDANGYMAKRTTKFVSNSNVDKIGVPGLRSEKSNDPTNSSKNMIHISHSMKSVKVDTDKRVTSSSQLAKNSRSVRSGSKAPKSKVVDLLKPTKLSCQGSLEGRYDISHRYSFKGIFPYEMFVKLYNWKQFELQPRGLQNCGNSCYANAVLQCLVYTPPLTAYLLEGIHSKACDKRGWCFTCEFEGLVMKAKDGNSPLSPVRILENIGSNLGNGKEEDAHEFLRYVVDTLQSVCVKEARRNLNSFEEETTLIGLTFGGYIRSKITCMKCGGKSEQHERMMDLTVEIEGDIRTLEGALYKFTSTEILDSENKYKCSRCKSYEKAKKKLTILEAPNVLTIALKRFKSGKFGKLNKSIHFPEILDLAPYVSGTSDKSPIYMLYGVVVHVDTMNAAFSGHYVCYVKNLQNRWFKFDDSMVNEVDLQHVLAKGAYMLLYARCSPRAPRSIRSSLINHHDSRKDEITEPWNAGNYHPQQVHQRSLDDESSSSDNSGFFSESCSCSTESTHRDSSSIEDHISGDWAHEYHRNINLNSSDSDTSSSSSSSFSSPLYSRLSHLYGHKSSKVCSNLDCSCNCCSRVTNMDRLGGSRGVTFRRSTPRRKAN